jgi:hypothetical protein
MLSETVRKELGDECVFFLPPVFSDAAIVSVHDQRHALQPEYNNGEHACTADQ